MPPVSMTTPSVSCCVVVGVVVSTVAGSSPVSMVAVAIVVVVVATVIVVDLGCVVPFLVPRSSGGAVSGRGGLGGGAVPCCG